MLLTLSASPYLSAQVVREERGDTFKYILVRDNGSGQKGVESTDGRVLVPMGKYDLIVFHSSNGGWFGLHRGGIESAYSVEGTELIPFSRGYEFIAKQKEYFGVMKDGLEGACDFNGNEIIAPQYSDLIYSSLDGFNTKENGKWVPLGIVKGPDGSFSGMATADIQYAASDNRGTASEEQVNTAGAAIGASNSSYIEPASSPSDGSFPAYNASGTIDKDQYRRSSLCLILLTHKDKKYAAAMERVFRNFPPPLRYNEHNISDVRVISVTGKQSKRDIDNLLRRYDVAQKVVGRWFNRNSYGRMDMDLIHDRGGFGASYADYARAKSNVRGTAMLQDEGIELLQSTYVLVCDMDYRDKSKSFLKGLGEGLLVAASAVAAGAAQYEYAQAQQQAWNGNYYAAQSSLNRSQAYMAGSATAAVGAQVVDDIGGFTVKMNAYLYKLRWDDSMTNMMFRDYWVDTQTPYSEAQEKKKKFDNAKYTFKLDYVGKYSQKSSKTILRSGSSEDEVILDVCGRTVNKGMSELARKFPVFRPRTPFYFDGGNMYAHIGTKEEVSNGRRYDIISPYKDKRGQIRYKVVGMAIANSVWDNKNIRFDNYFDVRYKGSRFEKRRATVDLMTPGLQLREQ